MYQIKLKFKKNFLINKLDNLLNMCMSYEYTKANPRYTDILVVGAGCSGLTSVFKISKTEPSLSIRILESSDCLGGEMGFSNISEISNKYITTDHYHIYNLLLELKVPLRRRRVDVENLNRCWEIDRGIFSSLVNFELRRYISELHIRAQTFRPGNCK